MPRNNQITNFLKGAFLLPWIWSFGFWIILSTFFFTYYFKGLSIFELEIPGVYSSPFLSLFDIWILYSAFGITNYSFSYFLKSQVNKINALLFGWNVLFGILVAIFFVTIFGGFLNNL